MEVSRATRRTQSPGADGAADLDTSESVWDQHEDTEATAAVQTLFSEVIDTLALLLMPRNWLEILRKTDKRQPRSENTSAASG